MTAMAIAVKNARKALTAELFASIMSPGIVTCLTNLHMYAQDVHRKSKNSVVKIMPITQHTELIVPTKRH